MEDCFNSVEQVTATNRTHQLYPTFITFVFFSPSFRGCPNGDRRCVERKFDLTIIPYNEQLLVNVGSNSIEENFER